MLIGSHLSTFAGRPVQEFDPISGISDPQGHAYALRVAYGEQVSFGDKLAQLVADPAAGQVEALVIGTWAAEMWEVGAAEVVAALQEVRAQLPRLQALFIGDITYEEAEISWIVQGNIGPLLDAFPLLEVLHTRGGQGLRFEPCRHERLRELVVQSGGLDRLTVQDIVSAELPNLEHLEIWFGSQYYGSTSSVEDVAPLLTGERFPHLRYLGLRNCEYADELAAALATAPILKQINYLDISMGTLSDEGMLALFDGLIYTLLETLDLSENFLSSEMVRRLKDIPFNVLARDQKDDEDEYRYVSVGE